MGMIELTKEISTPQHRSNRGSLVLGLLLLGAGYWTVGQGIILWHKGIRAAVNYAIANDVAQTGLSKAEITERAIYSTAVKLDECRASIEAVSDAIKPLPLGGPSSAPNR